MGCRYDSVRGVNNQKRNKDQGGRQIGKSNNKRRVEVGLGVGGLSCKCDLSINIAFSKTAISCFPRRLERDVSLEESRHGHVSSCARNERAGEAKLL